MTTADTRRLRLLSANIQAGSSTRRYSDYVTRSWSHALPAGNKRGSLDAIAQMAAEHDIVGLQEADPGSLRSGFTNQTHYRAEQGFTRPDPAIMSGGRRSSHHAPISRPLWASMIASHGRVVSRRILKGRSRRRLNPLFVGWLMGWPIGHALCACSATEFTLWQQHMRGALSQLPMASGPWIWRPTDAAQRPAQMDFLEGLQP